MSGTDNFQDFLASHRKEKARIKALRQSAAGAATAASIASLGSQEPVWQLKVHSNDPRDLVSPAVAQVSSVVGAITPTRPPETSPSAAAPLSASDMSGQGAFTIGGTTFMPAAQQGYSPAPAEKSGIVNSLISSLKSPRTDNTSSPASDSPARDSSITLLKSMTNALSRIKNKDRPDGESAPSAMEELQELARLANMASSVNLPQPSHSSEAGAGREPPRSVERGYVDHMHTERFHTPEAHRQDDAAVGRARAAEVDGLTQELQAMRQQQSKIRISKGGFSSSGSDVLESPHMQIGGASLTSPNEADRLKQQLDGMRHHLEQMHAQQMSTTQQQQQQPAQGSSPQHDETWELMNELERMRARLRHVENSKLGLAQGRPVLSGDVEIQPDQNARIPNHMGYSSPSPQSHEYREDDYAQPRGGGGMPSSMHKQPDDTFVDVGLKDQQGTGQRPPAIIAAEARLHMAYARLEVLAKIMVVLGTILFFPGIFCPYGFPCWGGSLPLLGLGSVYAYMREPELRLPVSPSGNRGSKVFMLGVVVVTLMLIVAGGFSAKGADVVAALFGTPVCGAIMDCGSLDPTVYFGNASGYFSNMSNVIAPQICMPRQTFGGTYDTCEMLRMCKGGSLVVGDCRGINGVNVFVSVYTLLSAAFIVSCGFWSYSVLDVRIHEHINLLQRDQHNLQDDYEYADLSVAACLNLLCEDWGKLMGSLQLQGFNEATNQNPLPADNVDRMQNRQSEQHGDHGLTAEALEARILTPSHAKASMSMGTPEHRMYPSVTPRDQYSVRSPASRPQEYY